MTISRKQKILICWSIALVFTSIVIWYICFVCANINDRRNQWLAKTALNNIKVAEVAYHGNNGTFGTLQNLISSGLLNAAFLDGIEYGHKFVVRTNGNTYEAIATEIGGRRGRSPLRWSMFIDESGIFRCKLSAQGDEATASDPPMRND